MERQSNDLKRHSKFTRISGLKQTLFRMGPFIGGTLFLGIIASISALSFFPIASFASIIFIIVLINSRGIVNTESIEFTSHSIQITKAAGCILLNNDTEYQHVVHKSSAEGIKFYSGNRRVYIWDHEFEDIDWKKIKRRVRKYQIIKPQLNIYHTGIPSDELNF